MSQELPLSKLLAKVSPVFICVSNALTLLDFFVEATASSELSFRCMSSTDGLHASEGTRFDLELVFRIVHFLERSFGAVERHTEMRECGATFRIRDGNRLV